jgi:hypothetical protein
VSVGGDCNYDDLTLSLLLSGGSERSQQVGGRENCNVLGTPTRA